MQGMQKETWEPIVKILPLPTFRRILETLRVKWRNSKLRFTLPERGNKNIQHFLELESNPQLVAFTVTRL